MRIVHDSADEGVFVRSMAARDRLGGLADQTLAAMVVMRALFDRVLIETVGVGQSETDVAGVADTVVFCVQPGSGDSLQFMKAGIVEIPHVIAVTKADLGGSAERARADVAGALSLATASDGDRAAEGAGRLRAQPSGSGRLDVGAGGAPRPPRADGGRTRPPPPERGLGRPRCATVSAARALQGLVVWASISPWRPARSPSSGCTSWSAALQQNE